MTAQQGQRIARSALPAPGRIIVLNGCSSAGKSSLARALQSTLAEPQLHVQLDVFRDMEPAGYWDECRRSEWPVRLAALCRAMQASCIEYAAHGLDVVLDHALTPDAWHYLAEDFRGRRVWLVGVHCPVDQLAHREALRGDRPSGLAASQFAWIHRDRVYDVDVDTSAMPAEACAAIVVARLGNGQPPAAFNALRQQFPTA